MHKMKYNLLERNMCLLFVINSVRVYTMILSRIVRNKRSHFSEPIFFFFILLNGTQCPCSINGFN